MWIKAAHCACRALDFGLVDIVGSEDYLPLQIRERHTVVINDAKRSDTRGGKVEQHRCAKATGTDDKHTRGLELRLTGSAHFAQHDMASIAFKFAGIEHLG